jgi:hypothetical protein
MILKLFLISLIIQFSTIEGFYYCQICSFCGFINHCLFSAQKKGFGDNPQEWGHVSE